MQTLNAHKANITLQKLIDFLDTGNISLFKEVEIKLLNEITNNTGGNLKLSVYYLLNSINKGAKELADALENSTKERTYITIQVLFIHKRKMISFDTVLRQGDEALYLEHIKSNNGNDDTKYTFRLTGDNINKLGELLWDATYSILLLSTTVTKELMEQTKGITVTKDIHKLTV